MWCTLCGVCVWRILTRWFWKLPIKHFRYNFHIFMQMMNIMLWILDMQPVLRRQSVVCLCRSAACMAVVQRRRSPPISTMCAIIARRRQTYNFVWWDLWPQANQKPKMHTAQHTVNVIWESVTKFIISKGTLTHFFPFLRIYFFLSLEGRLNCTAWSISLSIFFFLLSSVSDGGVYLTICCVSVCGLSRIC